MLRRMVVLSMLAALMLGAGEAWREADSAFSQAQTVDVAIKNFAFQPQTITVPVGTTVRWTNEDNVAHTSTSNSGVWDSGTLRKGQSFSFTFMQPGTFPYFCYIHPSMTASITVTGTAAEEEVQEFASIHSLQERKLFPGTLTVRKGVKVRLFNTALDGVHPSVAISSDEDGQKPVFGVMPFSVEPGKLTTVEFVPDQAGEFFITHKPHGHDIVGKLIVKD